MAKEKMPWLKTRLREIGRTPAALTRHLNLKGPRVYEMIAGRRSMQPDEIGPTAQFLDWSVDELIRRLPAADRLLPAGTKTTGGKPPGKDNSVLSTTRVESISWIPVLTTTGAVENACDVVLSKQPTRYFETLPAFRGRTDIRCLYMASAAMKPWRDAGDLVIFEQDRPPRENDYVVIYLADGDGDEICVLVRQLLTSKSPGKLTLRQHNPQRDTTIERKAVSSMFRVMTWDDCIR
jgi:hypothetical protein